MNSQLSETDLYEQTEKNKKRIKLTSFIAYAIFIVLIIFQAFQDEGEVVPLVNLPQTYHIILFTIVWPIIGCMLAIFVFPHILIPLYLGFKRKITHREYEDCLIEIETPITWKLVLSRAFRVFLLIMGLEAAVMPLLDLTQFYMPSQLTNDDIPLDLLPYNPQAFVVTAGIIFPLAMILWVVVWGIEDSGLMHYHLSEDPTKYQEIEPVFFKIAGFVKGFAGISSLFFYFTAIYHLAQQPLSELINLVWIASISIIVIIWSAPFIMIYFSKKFDWITKGITKIARIQIEDLQFS